MGRFSPDIFWGFVEVVVRPRLSELRRTRSPRCARARAASFPDQQTRLAFSSGTSPSVVTPPSPSLATRPSLRREAERSGLKPTRSSSREIVLCRCGLSSPSDSTLALEGLLLSR